MSSIYWNNTKIFAAFAELEKAVNKKLVQKRYHFFHFSDKIVAERLAQRFVELCFPPYAKSCAIRYSHSVYPLPQEIKIKLGGLIVDQETGSIQISAKFFIICILKFCFLWFRLLKYLFFSVHLKATVKKKKITLLFGVARDSIFQNGSDARFMKYLQSGPINPLIDADLRIVYHQEHLQSKSSDTIIYHPLPVEALIKYADFDLFERISLLLTHISSLFLFLFSLIKQPLSALLFSDAAYSRIVQKADSLGAISHIVITNTNFQQYTWMRETKRNFSVHQVYYSQNIKPYVYKIDPISADYPAYKHIKVDEIWVWNDDIKKYLQQLGIRAKMHVVGPILWYLPNHEVTRKIVNYDIIVFDITPITNEVAIELGVINNYYSTKNLIRFITDIMLVCKEIGTKYSVRINIKLKNKRALSAIHDTVYADFISGLLETGELSELVDNTTDLYSLLSITGLSITIPFSSPATISDVLNKPAIVYDFSELLINNYSDSPYISFTSGKVELAKKIIQIFNLEYLQPAIN